MGAARRPYSSSPEAAPLCCRGSGGAAAGTHPLKGAAHDAEAVGVFLSERELREQYWQLLQRGDTDAPGLMNVAGIEPLHRWWSEIETLVAADGLRVTVSAEMIGAGSFVLPFAFLVRPDGSNYPWRAEDDRLIPGVRHDPRLVEADWGEILFEARARAVVVAAQVGFAEAYLTLMRNGSVRRHWEESAAYQDWRDYLDAQAELDGFKLEHTVWLPPSFMVAVIARPSGKSYRLKVEGRRERRVEVMKRDYGRERVEAAIARAEEALRLAAVAKERT